jgi:hypothetical protein
MNTLLAAKITSVITRQIQIIRKDLNLNVTQKINVLIDCSDKNDLFTYLHHKQKYTIRVGVPKTDSRTFLRENCLIDELIIKTGFWITTMENDIFNTSNTDEMSEELYEVFLADNPQKFEIIEQFYITKNGKLEKEEQKIIIYILID